MNMKCPLCHATLISLEFADIEIDYCMECKGIWLDIGELEHLIAQDGEKGCLEPVAATRLKEKGRACPICAKTMTKIHLGPMNDILLDQCPVHGIWFDPGELKKIISAGRDEKRSNLLVQLLDEFFPWTDDQIKGGN